MLILGRTGMFNISPPRSQGQLWVAGCSFLIQREGIRFKEMNDSHSNGTWDLGGECKGKRVSSARDRSRAERPDPEGKGREHYDSVILAFSRDGFVYHIFAK